MAGAMEAQVTLLAITHDAQKIIEMAGRTCWGSFEKVSDNSQTGFIRRLIEMGHESPLEHALASFQLKNCSRAMTHQLVRHRLMSVCQQSQRYVDEREFEYVVPDSMPAEFLEDYHNDMRIINGMYGKWRDRGLKKEDARFVLPNACTSELVVSANFREWRHIIRLRTSKKSQWEIQKVSRAMLEILYAHAPAVFEDLRKNLDHNTEAKS